MRMNTALMDWVSNHITYLWLYTCIINIERECESRSYKWVSGTRSPQTWQKDSNEGARRQNVLFCQPRVGGVHRWKQGWHQVQYACSVECGYAWLYPCCIVYMYIIRPIEEDEPEETVQGGVLDGTALSSEESDVEEDLLDADNCMYYVFIQFSLLASMFACAPWVYPCTCVYVSFLMLVHTYYSTIM